MKRDQLRRSIEARELSADEAAEALPDIVAQVWANFWEYQRNEGRMQLDDAFGFDGSGCNPWPSLRRWWCNKALRAASAILSPPDISISDRAEFLRREIVRYGNAVWPKTRNNANIGSMSPIFTVSDLTTTPKAEVRAKIDLLLFVAFQAVDGKVAVSPDGLRNILSDTTS